MTRSPLSASVSSGASGEGAWRNDAIGSATSKTSAIARHQQRVERARRLALAAFRPSGLGGLVPGVNVEMQPRRGGGGKPAQVQRSGDLDVTYALLYTVYRRGSSLPPCL